MGAGEKIQAKFGAAIAGVRNDPNFSRVGRGVKAGARGFRAGAGRYLLSKVPICTWLPSYAPAWLLGDIFAGASVGLLMFPRAVMFSAMAGLPVQVALTSSWLPSIISALFGTSKDMSTGPLFMPSLIVGHIVSVMSASGLPPVLIAAVMSLCVGIWSLLIGLLNLGFIFDSLSVPIVTGFTCGMAITTYMRQVAPLFGLVGVSPMLAQLTPQFIAKLPETNLFALALGAGCIVFLVAMQKVETKWGGGNQVLRTFLASRNLFVLLLSISISYIVNKDREEPRWLSVGPVKTEIQGVQGLSFELVKGLFFPSFMVWFSITIEHILMAKALARSGGYVIDPSQELVHLGISNIINSFMGGLPVGAGDASTAAVNIASGVKSPLSGLIVAAVVGAGMQSISGFVELLPLPAVAAVIIVAVINAMPSPADMGKYWKWSFADFGVFILTFNVALIMTPEMGFQVGGVILITYTLFRAILSRPRAVPSIDLERQYGIHTQPCWDRNEEFPLGVCVMRLKSDLMFANAEKTKRRLVDIAMMTHSAIPSIRNKNDRVWNECRDKHVQYLRRKAGIAEDDRMLPRLQAVVLDMSATCFIDSSGLHALEDVKSQLRSYGGPDVEFRFVGMDNAIRTRFRRAEWTLVDPYDQVQETTTTGGEEAPADYVFDHLPHAIRMQPQKQQQQQQQVDMPGKGPRVWEKEDTSAVNEEGQWPMVPRDMI